MKMGVTEFNLCRVILFYLFSDSASVYNDAVFTDNDFCVSDAVSPWQSVSVAFMLSWH